MYFRLKSYDLKNCENNCQKIIFKNSNFFSRFGFDDIFGGIADLLVGVRDGSGGGGSGGGSGSQTLFHSPVVTH